MPRYAAGTDVSVDQSQAEIRQTLNRYGAENYVMGTVSGRIAVMFEVHGRRVRLSVPEATITQADRARRVNQTDRAKPRTDAEIDRLRDQRELQQWRIIALVIKAKIEIIETGAVTFEDEFLPYTMLPSGETVGEWIEPQMRQAATTGQMPPMLPGVSGGAKVIELAERSGT